MEKAYTKEQFIEDLFEVANVWVEEAMCDLAERTDELWENEIAKKLVRKCAEARRESRKWRKNAFVEAMKGIDGCAADLAEMAGKRSGEYTSMVYELLASDK